MENFERLPAHDATGGPNVCSHTGDDDDDRAQQETKRGESGDAVSGPGAESSVAGQSNAFSGGGTEIGGVSRDGLGESKLAAGEDGQAAPQQRQEREARVIPAKFLKLISAGLSTDLDPKVWETFGGRDGRAVVHNPTFVGLCFERVLLALFHPGRVKKVVVIRTTERRCLAPKNRDLESQGRDNVARARSISRASLRPHSKAVSYHVARCRYEWVPQPWKGIFVVLGCDTPSDFLKKEPRHR